MSSRHITTVLAALVVVSTAAGVSAPAPHADAAPDETVAVAPRSNVAAIYNEFGLNELDKETLDTVADDLSDEVYKVKRYTDTTQGAGSRGGAITGTTTPVSVTFDAKMVEAAPKGVVTASGCGASIANAKWARDTEFAFDLKVPKVQPGKTMTLTVHHDAAKSAGGYPHVLDGNQDPGAAGESGVAPNGDDYVWHLSCAPSTKFKMVYSGTYEYT